VKGDHWIDVKSSLSHSLPFLIEIYEGMEPEGKEEWKVLLLKDDSLD